MSVALIIATPRLLGRGYRPLRASSWLARITGNDSGFRSVGQKLSDVSTEALASAMMHQPRARVALSAALASGPSHAYLFRGPRGSGKRAAARAFAAEILAAGAADPEDARRRALLDPSPHPDLVWLTPPGAQHMVE